MTDQVLPKPVTDAILLLAAVASFTLICTPAVRGFWPIVLVVALFVSPGMPVYVTYVARKRSPWDVLNPRKQSWAFMFGDTLCVAPALSVAAAAWGLGLVPDFARTKWWWVAMIGLGIVASIVLTKADRKRYEENDALAAYERPDKIFHDKVVVRVLISSLLVLAFPLLFVWTIYTSIIVGLLAGWAVLIVIDDKFRFVDPKWQYDLA